MTSVMKSPNMMSTTGRIPVIAAPRPIPVIPASEMGESRTRSGPNSSTRPDSTLKGVPASATSSPITKTLSSRRISSASASLTACASEISRVPSCSLGSVVTLGEDMLVHFVGIGKGSVQRGLDAGLDLRAYAALDLLELAVVGGALLAKPLREQANRVALALPLVLFLLRAVVRAVDVTDVMAVVA